MEMLEAAAAVGRGRASPTHLRGERNEPRSWFPQVEVGHGASKTQILMLTLVMRLLSSDHS